MPGPPEGAGAGAGAAAGGVPNAPAVLGLAPPPASALAALHIACSSMLRVL